MLDERTTVRYSVDVPISPVQTQSDLRVIRKARGWKLEAAAQKAGMDKAHLSRVERGLGTLSVSSLIRLALVYEIEPGELLKALPPEGVFRQVPEDP